MSSAEQTSQGLQTYCVDVGLISGLLDHAREVSMYQNTFDVVLHWYWLVMAFRKPIPTDRLKS